MQHGEVLCPTLTSFYVAPSWLQAIRPALSASAILPSVFPAFSPTLEKLLRLRDRYTLSYLYIRPPPPHRAYTHGLPTCLARIHRLTPIMHPPTNSTHPPKSDAGK